jgi:hypothetical protein
MKLYKNEHRTFARLLIYVSKQKTLDGAVERLNVFFQPNEGVAVNEVVSRA